MADANDTLQASTTPENITDIIAIVASLAPLVGGPVSMVLSGMSLNWKLKRVREVLTRMSEELRDFKSEASEKYVETEEFQELLERTLKQAADERDEGKRKMYAAFLADTVKSPGESYDEQIRFLRTLEELQSDHIRIFKVMLISPDSDPPFGSNRGQVLVSRLPDIPAQRVIELAQQLNDMKVTQIGGLSGMMTGHGAQDFSQAFTPYGTRFLKYIRS